MKSIRRETSVDRDDLRDGGAAHFRDCIREVRARSPQTRIEVLVPDFRGRLDTALDLLSECPPDVMNHNLETVPRLYKQARPGSDYAHSLKLLKNFKARFPHIPAKSGLMVGLGETDEEIVEVMRDLRAHDVDMLTIGQYLQPSVHHLPVLRYVEPATFDRWRETPNPSVSCTQRAVPSCVRAITPTSRLTTRDRAARLKARASALTNRGNFHGSPLRGRLGKRTEGNLRFPP